MDYFSTLEYFSTKTTSKWLGQGLHGLEKESLRVTRNGELTLTPHPKKLSNPLTDPHITTDFSESQIEFITSPFPKIEQALSHLEKLHRRAAAELGEELIWPFSMPPKLPSEEKIPIARYGSSQQAKEKETYRKGLALRYGKYMQTISGIHYNMSFSQSFWKEFHTLSESADSLQDFMNEKYLHLARNFIRHRWLLAYLFGTSPLLDESYGCKLMCKETEYAVSLRLSRCGYSNPAKIPVRLNRFKDYLEDLIKAADTPYPRYTALGIEKNGERIQLNDHLLQIGNEYYAPIRLKPPKPYRDVLIALKRHGVQYIESRVFDLNPFEPLGISAETLYFSHLFLLFCLLSDSPPIEDADLAEATYNQEHIALYGRKPGIVLKRYGKKINLDTWGEEILNKMKPLAAILDKNFNRSKYLSAWQKALRGIRNPLTLPSNKVIQKIEASKENFITFGIHKAMLHRRYLLRL